MSNAAHKFESLIGDEKFDYGLRVGVELAWAAKHKTMGGTMGARDRSGFVTDLWGTHDSSDEVVHCINHYENCTVNVNHGVRDEELSQILRVIAESGGRTRKA